MTKYHSTDQHELRSSHILYSCFHYSLGSASSSSPFPVAQPDTYCWGFITKASGYAVPWSKLKIKSLSKRFNLKYSPNLRQVHRVPSRAQESMQRDCIKASWDGYSLTDNTLAYFCQGKGKETPPKKILPTFYPFFLFILWKRKDIPIPIYQQIPQHCTRGRGDTDLLQ